jgi:hypothetical protein
MLIRQLHCNTTLEAAYPLQRRVIVDKVLPGTLGIVAGQDCQVAPAPKKRWLYADAAVSARSCTQVSTSREERFHLLCIIRQPALPPTQYHADTHLDTARTRCPFDNVLLCTVSLQRPVHTI